MRRGRICGSGKRKPWRACSAAALRSNFPGYTSEIRSTDRVMRFAQFLAKDYQFDEYRRDERRFD